MIRSAVCLSLLTLAVGLSAPLATAQTPVLFFDTEIVSLDFSGSAMLPLGPAGMLVDTQVSGNKVQDHNSSRSNKTASIIAPPDPDDVNPDEEDGETFDLFSAIAIDFDLSFDTGGLGDPDLCPGGLCVGNPESPLALDLDLPSDFIFDKTAPDFGMLSGGTKALEHRGHVTVLKIAVGGGGAGSEVLIGADGILLATVPGTSKFTTTPTGDLRHSIVVTLDLVGTFNGAPFQALGLTGTMIEEGRLLNAIVPEPTSVMLLAAATLTALVSRRR
jgi:hypothetical protein